MSRPLRLLAVAGTRPEAIKLAPLLLAAAARPDIALRLAATRQHDRLFDEALAAFGLAADVMMDVAPHDRSIAGSVAAMRAATRALLAIERPDMLLVQGDTSSAYAAALAAADLGVPTGHVEAGLRSGDLGQPFPEEGNRIAIDALAALLFAPTTRAAANLRGEALGGEIHVTGNTGIDALLVMRDRLRSGAATAPLVEELAGGGRRLVLATCHRRESFGAPLARICGALRMLADRGDIVLLLPVHPNSAVRGPVEAALGMHPAIRLVPLNLPYPEMVAAQHRAHLILSDSGGVQEEAPALGTPVLVLRRKTERQEGVESGNLLLVGDDPATILAAAARLLDEPAALAAMARPAFPFGSGDAAGRILEACARHFRSH